MSFTHDWSASRVHWPFQMAELPDNPRILEIGCYEGQATRWFLENLPGSVVTVVDPFNAATGQRSRFYANVEEFGPRVTVYDGPSSEQLFELGEEGRRFELVYVDGSHYPADVLFDATVSWRLLTKPGLLLFDDYDWPDAPGGQNVQIAVDAFATAMDLVVERVGPDQALIRK